MTIFRTIAFYGFMAAAAELIGNGILYLLADKIMPYHCKAMGKPWEELPDGAKTMSICFMKSAAAGMLSSGAAIVLLLVFPFRAGELWSDIAVSLTALLEHGIVFTRIMKVRSDTNGNPPIVFPAVILIIVFASIAFAIAGRVLVK